MLHSYVIPKSVRILRFSTTLMRTRLCDHYIAAVLSWLDRFSTIISIYFGVGYSLERLKSTKTIVWILKDRFGVSVSSTSANAGRVGYKRDASLEIPGHISMELEKSFTFDVFASRFHVCCVTSGNKLTLCHVRAFKRLFCCPSKLFSTVSLFLTVL